MTAVALGAVKDFLNITSATHDDELINMIDRAEAVLAARVGSLSPITVTNEVHIGPGPLQLRRLPVLSVTAATSDGYPVGDLDLDGDTGILWGSFGYGRRKVRVTYTAGRAMPLPADLEAALLELAAHLWRSQRGIAPSPLNVQDDDDTRAGLGYLLPYRVQALLEPYILPQVA